MTKIKFNSIKGHFPLTIQNAKLVNKVVPIFSKGIVASNYQSNNVNQQQFYKPISKILQF